MTAQFFSLPALAATLAVFGSFVLSAAVAVAAVRWGWKLWRKGRALFLLRSRRRERGRQERAKKGRYPRGFDPDTLLWRDRQRNS